MKIVIVTYSVEIGTRESPSTLVSGCVHGNTVSMERMSSGQKTEREIHNSGTSFQNRPVFRCT